MQITIDFRSEQPIYLQIVEQIRHKVTSGELRPGDQLPTVRQLAAELRVNFNTVARAYRLLDEAGLISTQHGRGTYIWETPNPQALQQLQQQNLTTLTLQYLKACSQLGCHPQEVVQIFQKYIEQWQLSGTPPNSN